MRHTLFWFLIFPVVVWGQPPAESDPWKFDELTLTNGAKFVGLLLEDTSAGVRFRIVSRQPGRPTVTLTTTFPKRDIDTTRRLADDERKRLSDRLAELDPTQLGERARMEALELKPADWNGKPGAGFRYESDHFTLVTGAPEEIARRAAVRLEQLSVAIRRFFPAPGTATPPVLVLLAPDRFQYERLIGKPVLNPAIYDPAANRIVCGSDLDRLGAELTGTRLHHQRQLADLARYEADVKKLYKGQKAELDRYLDLARAQRKKVFQADEANDAAFDRATWKLFTVLFHEAFHAYVGTVTFSPTAPGGELPRWLNEGLAQVFETAILEAAELRIDHVDTERLAKVKTLLKPGGEGLLPIPDLLRTGPDSFLAAHADQKAAAGRAYLTAWAVSVHLLLEKRVLGGDPFADYRKAVRSGGDPIKAFEAWTGQGVLAYEKELAEYLTKLKSNGPNR